MTCDICKRYQPSTTKCRKCGLEFCEECAGDADLDLCYACKPLDRNAEAEEEAEAEAEQRENYREYADWDF